MKKKPQICKYNYESNENNLVIASKHEAYEKNRPAYAFID